MVQSTQERTVAPPMEPPSQEEVKARLKAIYHPPHFIFGFIVAIGAVGLLAWAVTLQLNSIENYFYQPLVSIYSIIAGAFVITRFIFAAFYKAPAEADFEPTLTVLVPCFNEGAAIRKTLERIFSSGYPLDKLEVVCVNDGSSDDSLVHMQEAQTNHPGLVLVNFEKNRGLCHGWGVATFLARGEFMVCVDSDTFVFPGSLHTQADAGLRGPDGGRHLRPLRHRERERQHAHADAGREVLLLVQDHEGGRKRIRYRELPARMLFGVQADVRPRRDGRLDQRDRVGQARELRRRPFAHEPHPEGLQDPLRRPGARDDDLPRRVEAVGKFMWRKHPVPALSWYAMMWMPIVEPVVMVQALIVAPIQEGTLHPSYVIGVFTITLVWSLHFWITSGRRWWYAGILFTLSYIFFFGWQTYWGFLTLDGKKWGTRG